MVAQPAIADQNELIMQLMQQITKMRVEMQRRQDLSPSIFNVNASIKGMTPLHFPSSNMEQAKNPPSDPAHNPSIIDLSTKSPQYASVPIESHPLLKTPILKCHLPFKMSTTKLVHSLKTKTHTIFKLPFITKINTPTPKHSLKTTKPSKMPKFPASLHLYLEKPLSKFRSLISIR